MILLILICVLGLGGMMNSFDEWLAFGRDKGWVSDPVCDIHAGLPLTPEEEWAFDQGADPCIHVLRLYEDIPHD